MTLTDFTLFNVRRFYSMGNPLAVKGLTTFQTNYVPINDLIAVGALMTFTDFILSNARRFYSLMGNHLSAKGLNYVFLFYQRKILLPQLLVTFQLWEMTDNSTISSTPAGAALVLQGFSYF